MHAQRSDYPGGSACWTASGCWQRAVRRPQVRCALFAWWPATSGPAARAMRRPRHQGAARRARTPYAPTQRSAEPPPRTQRCWASYSTIILGTWQAADCGAHARTRKDDSSQEERQARQTTTRQSTDSRLMTTVSPSPSWPFHALRPSSIPTLLWPLAKRRCS